MTMREAFMHWLNKERPGLPRWVSLLANIATNTIWLVLIFSTSLSLLQKTLFYFSVAMVSSLVWAVILAKVAAVRERRKQAKNQQKAWKAFVNDSHIIGGELELHTVDGLVRGPIVGLKRDGNEILFERAWLARHDETGWEHFESREGTDYRVSSVDAKPPVRRADKTLFLNLPDLGSAIIYPREHPELLGLKAAVSLEPIETPA